MLNRTTILVVLVMTAGCSETYTESDAWRQARESIDRQEWQATNGMAWPSNAISPEIVMAPGMGITAQTANGNITIRAGLNYERFYTWNEATRSAKLKPRVERWYGSLGIINTEPVPWRRWKSNKGITRGVLGEGVLWFKTVDDAANWIKMARSTVLDYVFTDDGLLIGFGMLPARRELNVEVWQIMIAGKKPHSLPGSQNGLVSVSK